MLDLVEKTLLFTLCFCSSLQSAEASLKHLDSGYFLGKVCFMVTNGTENAFGSSMKHKLQCSTELTTLLSFIVVKGPLQLSVECFLAHPSP